MFELKMLIQIFITVYIFSWGLKQLVSTTKEILQLAEVDMKLLKLQKTKNLAPSLATQRDPIIGLSVKHQGAKSLAS